MATLGSDICLVVILDVDRVFIFPLRLINLWIFQPQVLKVAIGTYNTQTKI